MNEGQTATLLAVHIPKAAGTTLRVILERQYPEAERFVIRHDIPAERERLAGMADADKRGLRAVFGHMPWGWHALLASGQRYRYLTMLREPRERVLSLYATCRMKTHYLHEAVKDLTLYEFVTSGVTRTADEGMVRQLCGADAFLRVPWADMALPFGGVTEAHLEAARANLARCAFVGVAERFDALMAQCRRRLGWRIPAVPDQNVTTWARPQWDDLDGRTRAAVRDCTRLDAELYAYAVEVGL